VTPLFVILEKSGPGAGRGFHPIRESLTREPRYRSVQKGADPPFLGRGTTTITDPIVFSGSRTISEIPIRR
jgi:hypothetical protein